MARLLQRRADLEVKITQAHRDSHGTYGSPRITAEPRDQGEVVTAKTVANIMAGVGPRASAHAPSRSRRQVIALSPAVLISAVSRSPRRPGAGSRWPPLPRRCEPSHDRRADSA
ncbi:MULTISPECIES: IS3 family transposase [Amycolatopsis]|uniref:IS3 family transposase n=1 Tax=Amycolatopsis TaxID=1813 RepID=UPI0027E0DE83|nr:IS3 family transposase [Amycolatopsis tucumanensis]